MAENEKELWQAFDAASRKIKSSLAMKSGGSGAENDYSAAYQKLADAGLVQPLRPKYK